MNECLYTKKLAWFKQNERPETVLVVADNPEAIRVVIAWTNLKVQRAEKLTELRADSENEVWEWLWKNTRYSKTELMEKSGLSISESGLDSRMKPLIGNRVI